MKVTWAQIIGSAFLVLGNVLGVGILAMPITAGLAGFIPSFLGIGFIWLLMLLTAFIIAYSIRTDRKHFDLPSFYEEKLGGFAKWIAIIGNLVILYGVLVAYLSGISSIIAKIFPVLHNYQIPVMIVYFAIMFYMIVTGNQSISKKNIWVIGSIWVCFFIMISTGFAKFSVNQLFATNEWQYMPIMLPIAISAFHFHNIIPTVSKNLSFDFKKTCLAITIGLVCGLVINLLWSLAVLGTLAKSEIVSSYVNGVPATVPMDLLLQNKIFLFGGLIFAVLAVTAAFIANGAGLFGFIGDLAYKYFKVENKYIIGSISFVPPIVFAIVYPKIFITAISLVGGIGEDLLFLTLPGVVLLSLGKNTKYHRLFQLIGWIMVITSLFICIYVFCQKFLGIFTPHF